MRILSMKHNKVILIMALMFALFHQNIIQTVYTFVGRLVLYGSKDQTYGNIIVHLSTTNVLMGIPQKNGVIYAGYSALMNAVTQNAFILFASWILRDWWLLG